MKTIRILFFVIIASLSSCDCGCDSSGDSMTYNNLYAIIISKETVPDKYFIVRGVADTTLIGEIHSKNINSFTDSIFYNKKVGDTVFFVYIRKDRFWHTSQKHKNESVTHDNDSIQIVIVGDAPFYKHTVIKVKGANSIKEFTKVKNITKDASGFFVFGEADYNEWKTNDTIK